MVIQCCADSGPKEVQRVLGDIEELDAYFDNTPVVLVSGNSNVVPGADNLSADAGASSTELPFEDAVVKPTLSESLAFLIALAFYEPPWSPTAWLLSRPTGADSYHLGLAHGHSAYRKIVAWLRSLPHALPTQEQSYQWHPTFDNFTWATLTFLRSLLREEQFCHWPLILGHSYWFALVWLLPLLTEEETYQEIATPGHSVRSASAWLSSPPVTKEFHQWALTLGHSAYLWVLVFGHSVNLWCLTPLAYLTYWWGLALGHSIRRAIIWLLSLLAQKTYQWILALGHSAYLSIVTRAYSTCCALTWLPSLLAWKPYQGGYSS